VWTDGTVAVFGSGTLTNCTVTLTTNVAPYAITFNANAGGTYTLTGTNAILLNIPGSPLSITANANATLGASLVGPNGLVKQGAGALTLTASNNYSGPTLVNAGILKLGTNTALGSSVSVASGATLDLNGQDLTTSMFGQPVNLSGTVAGAVALTNSSPSRGQLQDVQLSADTTITGPNTVFVRGTTGENGILNLNGHTLSIAGNVLLDGVNMTGPGNVTVNSGTLQLIDYYSNAQRDTSLGGTGNLTINAGAAVMTYRWGTALNVSMPLILNGGKLGSGWPGPNGATFACPILVNSNSLIDFEGGYGSGTLAGNITGPGGLIVTGDGNVRTFTGTNGYGWTTINGGTLQIGYGGTSGTLGRGGVTNNANLTFNRKDFLSVSNQISGPGALSQNGVGTVALCGTNTYTGLTSINAGVLQIGNGGNTGTLGPGNVANSATLVFARSGSLPVTNQISGPGALVQNGAGMVVLYGTNTYTGSTTVNAGTLLVNGTLAGGPVTVGTQGTLGGSGTLYGPTTIQPGGLLAPGCSNLTTLTVNNTLSLGGNVLFALNRTNAQTAAKIAGLSTVTCGGTLTVTNVGPNTFASGDTFTLLQAATYAGTFTNLSLPVLPAGLAWNTGSLLVNGTLSVSSVAAEPAISSAMVKGKFQFTVSGGSNQTYRVLAGTNLLQPMASWVVLTNGTFSGSPVTFTNATWSGFPSRYYRIATP
jgi:autotransporter-associated beta strand protein